MCLKTLSLLSKPLDALVNRLHLGRDHVDIDGGGLTLHPIAALNDALHAALKEKLHD